MKNACAIIYTKRFLLPSFTTVCKTFKDILPPFQNLVCKFNLFQKDSIYFYLTWLKCSGMSDRQIKCQKTLLKVFFEHFIVHQQLNKKGESSKKNTFDTAYLCSRQRTDTCDTEKESSDQCDFGPVTEICVR